MSRIQGNRATTTLKGVEGGGNGSHLFWLREGPDSVRRCPDPLRVSFDKLPVEAFTIPLPPGDQVEVKMRDDLGCCFAVGLEEVKPLRLECLPNCFGHFFRR